MDGSQRRDSILSEPDAVETSNGDIVRYAQSGLVDRMQRPESHLVAETEERGRALRQGEQFGRPLRAGPDREIADALAQVVQAAMRRRRGPRAGKTIPAQRAGDRTRDQSDPMMAECVQVIHHGPCGLRIVDMGARHRQFGTEFASVHDGRAAGAVVHHVDEV